MKFRRRVKLFPGVTLNFSRSGISTTIGVPGASINLGKSGTYLNTGIPGTGLYERRKLGGSSKKAGASITSKSIAEKGTEKELKSSADAEALTTQGLTPLGETLENCQQEKNEILAEIGQIQKRLRRSKALLLIMRILLIGFFIPYFRRRVMETGNYLDDLNRQAEDCAIDINLYTDEAIGEAFTTLSNAYDELLNCQKAWDVTGVWEADDALSRSGIKQKFVRRPVTLRRTDPEIIRSRFSALHFGNANGGDLFAYPAFVLISSLSGAFGVVDIRELRLNFKTIDYPEDGIVPADAESAGNTWTKVNKDGSPDRRFKGNRPIPLCRYGFLHFTTDSGLYEVYCLSNARLAENFYRAFSAYRTLIAEPASAESPE